MTETDLVQNPWAFGPWCWHIDAVRLLREPLAARGMPGLWPLPPEVREALWSQLELKVAHGLTVLQPYATAIAEGRKDIENRAWRRKVPPGWVALHAGALPHEHANDALVDWRRDGRWRHAPPLATMPLGVVMGAMHVKAIMRYPAHLQPF